jgi:hypothetical protein
MKKICLSICYKILTSYQFQAKNVRMNFRELKWKIQRFCFACNVYLYFIHLNQNLQVSSPLFAVILHLFFITFLLITQANKFFIPFQSILSPALKQEILQIGNQEIFLTNFITILIVECFAGSKKESRLVANRKLINLIFFPHFILLTTTKKIKH